MENRFLKVVQAFANEADRSMRNWVSTKKMIDRNKIDL